jgi:hypothetical protein
MGDALRVASDLAESLAMLAGSPSIQSLFSTHAPQADFTIQALRTRSAADGGDLAGFTHELERLLDAAPANPPETGTVLDWERLKRHKEIILWLVALFVAIYLSSQTDGLVQATKEAIDAQLNAAERRHSVQLQDLQREVSNEQRQLRDLIESKYREALERCAAPEESERLQAPYFEAKRATTLRQSLRSSQAVGVVRKGEIVQRLDVRKHWIRIRRYDIESDSLQEGWVRKRYFQKVY